MHIRIKIKKISKINKIWVIKWVNIPLKLILIIKPINFFVLINKHYLKYVRNSNKKQDFKKKI